MKINHLFRSIVACLLLLSLLCSLTVGVLGAPADSSEKEDGQIDISLEAEDTDVDLTQEEVDAQVEEKVESMMESAGLDIEEARGQTREIVSTECVFLDFRIGDASRNFNWQIKSDYMKDSATVNADTFNSRDRLYFSANYNGCIAGYYQGTDPRLYMPEINTSIANGKLGNYVVKSGDIVQVRIQSITANSDNGFVSKGTDTVNSLFALRTSYDATQYAGGTTAKLIKQTEAQILTFSINSNHYNKTLYGVRWDPSQTELVTSGVRIYLDYIYIGPKSKAPIPYYIYNENGAYFKNADGSNVGFGHVVNGKTGPKFAHGKTSTKNTTAGTQELWGWKVLEKENNAWVEKKFVLSPSDHVITKEVQFKLFKVVVPIAGLKSGQTVTSLGPEKFVISNDTISSAEIDPEKYCTPLDISLIMDRSASNDDIVSSKGKVTRTSSSTEANDLKSAKAILDKLDASKWPGYYRCSAWGYGHVDGNIHQRFTMPMRYYNGAWQVMMVSSSCDCYYGYHYNYGIFEWKSSALQACSHTSWVSFDTAYKFYRTEAQATSGSKGYVAFQIGISRMGMLQDALDQFTQLLYNSNYNMDPTKSHTLSVIGYGKMPYINGCTFRYYDNVDGTNKYKVLSTSNLGYKGGVSKSIATLTYGNYEAFNFCIKNYYVNGNTSTDTASQILTGTLNKFDKANGMTEAPIAKGDYIAAKTSGRNRVVILVTDGCPSYTLGSGVLFDKDTANKALAAAYTLKKDGVKIYAICLDSNVTVSNGDLVADSTFKWDLAGKDGYDSSEAMEGKRQHVFLQLYSSNFTGANSMDDRPARASTAYVKASNSSGSTITTIFKNVLTSEVAELSTSKVIGPGSLYIHQEINREFTIDPETPIRIYGAAHTTNNAYGSRVLLGEHSVTNTNTAQTFSGKGYTLSISPVSGTERFVVTLKWLDAQDAFIRNGDITTPIAGLSTKRGYKISMDIPCIVNRDNTLGGNNIPINVLNNSGLYKASDKNDTAKASAASIKYAQPNINVESTVSGRGYDYFMTLEELVSLQNTSAENVRKYILGNLCDGLEVRATNSAGKSTLDYLSFGISLKETESQKQVMSKTAGFSATSMTESWPQNLGDFDPLCDMNYTLNVTMNQRNNSKDTFGNEPFPSINVELNPAYYAPKFAVADFDGELFLDMQNEGDSTKLSYDASQLVLKDGHMHFNFKPDFDDANGQKQMMNEGYLTVDYTIDHANPTKAMAAVAPNDLTMERELYIIPGNVITYDDTYFHLYTNEYDNLAQWFVEGAYTEEMVNGNAWEGHGFEAAYMDNTGDLAGSVVVSTVSKDLPTSNASFEFTGTGFELLSRTAPDTGVIIAEIFPMEADGSYAEISTVSILVDTYLANDTLYQIPVIQWSSDYGRYKVVITGYYHKIFDHNRGKKDVITEETLRQILGLDESTALIYNPGEWSDAPATRAPAATEGQYNVYLDGIRVFNPLGDPATDPIADAVYSFANEGYANILNINDSILDANSSFKESEKVDGILYVASDVEGNSTTAELEDVYVNQGFHLGMSGNSSVSVEQVGDKYYLLDGQGNRVLHPVSGHPVYYTMNGTKPMYQAVVANELSVNSIYSILDRRYSVGAYSTAEGKSYAVYTDSGERLLTAEGRPVRFVTDGDGNRTYYTASGATTLTDYADAYNRVRIPYTATISGNLYYLLDQQGNRIVDPVTGGEIYSKSKQVTAPFYSNGTQIPDPNRVYKLYLDTLATWDVVTSNGQNLSYLLTRMGTPVNNKTANEFILAEGSGDDRRYSVVTLNTTVDIYAAYGLTTKSKTLDCDTCGQFTAQYLYFADGQAVTEMTRYAPSGTANTGYTPCNYALSVYYKEANGKKTYYYGHELRTIPHEDVYDAVGEVTYYDSYYEAIGPEKEVYLKGNSGIAFHVGTGAEKVMISFKSVGTAPSTVKIYNPGTNAWADLMDGFSFCTEMYFDITSYADGEGNIYIRADNGSNNNAIVSLCNVKIVGDTASVAVPRSLVRSASAIFKNSAELPLEEAVPIMHSLNLESNISINYIVPKTELAGYDRYSLSCEVAGKTYTPVGEERGNYIYFTLTGLNAAMMNENVTAQLTSYAGGRVYITPVDHYSIATYAYSMMNREGVSQQVKSLCANLLRYGAATQIFTGYNADALADEEMTAEQMAYLRDLDTVEFGAPYTILDDVAAPTVTWQGRTLMLDSTVAVKFLVYAPNVSTEDMELRVAYTGIDGTEKSLTVAPTVQNADAGAYVFLIDALAAAELRAELTCQVYVNGEAASKTMIYSAASYGNNKTGDLLNLCKALFAYVDEARAFFG